MFEVKREFYIKHAEAPSYNIFTCTGYQKKTRFHALFVTLYISFSTIKENYWL